MTSQEVCKRAAETIRRFGWVRGVSGNHEIGFCLNRAITVATYHGTVKLSYGESDRHKQHVRNTLFKLHPEVVSGSSWEGNLAYWNDHVCKDVDEVIALLEIAANDPGTEEVQP